MDDVLSKRFGDGFCVRVDVELVVDASEMSPDCIGTDKELIRNPFAVFPLSQEGQDIELS